MAIQMNGLPLVIYEYTDREVNWIYAQKKWNSPAESTAEKRNRLSKYMHTNSAIHEEIQNLRLESESYLLADEELEWIERSDIRLLTWLLHYCSRPHFRFGTTTHIPIPASHDLPESAYYDHFVTAVDNWSIYLRNKSRSLNEIKSIWSELLSKDRRLKWLRKDDVAQIDWAWAYLNTYFDKHQTFGRLKYSPITPQETHIAIMSTFDTWRGDTGDLYLLQTSMKQAWAQQKYRSSLIAKKKKQSTYVLGEKTKEHLEEIAIARNVNLNEMLEYIINQAYKDFKRAKLKAFLDKKEH